MFLHIDGAAHLGDHRVWLEFRGGSAGGVDLADELSGEVFKPLRDVAYFRQFELVGHTLAWENGADFAPEFLKQLAEEQKTLLSEAS